MVNSLFDKWGLFVCMCAYVCVFLNVSMFVSVLSLARAYIRMFAYVLACIFIYLHIFPQSVDGKGWDKWRECEKGKVDDGGWIVAIRISFSPTHHNTPS